MALDAKEKLDEALGELLRAADPVSKTVIRAYKHEVQYSENLSAISGSKFSTDVLERCAEFLDLTTRTYQKELRSSRISERLLTRLYLR